MSTEISRAVMAQCLDRAALRSHITDDGCWEFEGAQTLGYGVVGVHRRTWRLHRLAYYVMCDWDLPDRLVIDHLCRNRLCWNVEHLEPVPRGLNVLRGEAPTMVAYREGRCLRGHLNPDMYEYGGRRQCAVCARASARRRTAERRVVA